MKRTMIAASLLWVAASLIGCTKHTDQSTAAGAQQAASGASVALARNSAAASIEPTTATAQNPMSENSTATPTPANLNTADSQSEPQLDFEVAGIRLGMTRQETEQALHDVGFDSPTCAKTSGSSVFCVTDVWDERGRVADVKYTLDADRVSDVMYSFAPKLLAKMKSRLIANYSKPSGTEDFAGQRFTVWRSGRAELRLGRDGAGYALLILQLHQP